MTSSRSFRADLLGLPPNLRLLAASMFAWAAGEALFIYIVPLYLQQMGGTPVQIGNIISLVGAAAASAALPAGLLADRWGAKPVLWLGWIIGLVAGVFMAAAHTLPIFAAGWIMYSLTMFVGPAIAGYTFASRGNLPPERALTIISASYGLGNVISPALGGWISGQFGVRSLFFVGVGLFVVSTIFMYFVRADPVARDRVAGPGFRGLLANRRFVGFCALVLGVWVITWLGVPLAPNYLALAHGLSTAQVSTLGTFHAIGWVTLNLLLGRRPPRRMYLLAQGLMIVYLILILRANWIGWLALAYYARASMNVSGTLINAQASSLVERSQISTTFGLLSTLNWIGNTIAPLIAGRLYAVRPALPFQVALILLPAAILLTYWLAPRPRAAPEDESRLTTLSAAPGPET